jgi:hypothetical protein
MAVGVDAFPETRHATRATETTTKARTPAATRAVSLDLARRFRLAPREVARARWAGIWVRVIATSCIGLAHAMSVR